MICDEIVSWASTCRGTLKQSSKTCSTGRKTPRYSQNRAINYDLRQNHLLGFNVSRYTETVLGNVLRRSKNPQVQSKPRYKLWFATKSSPGHKRVDGYRNTPKNVLRRSIKLPGTVTFVLQAMICDEIVSWASSCRSTLKRSSKTCSASRKTPRYTLIRQEVIFKA